jgi:TonB-linked SusC/RagA family outer membrane protein
MKLSLIIILVFTTQAYSTGFAQGKISLSLKNVEMKKAISAIQRVSFYRFLYNDDILPKDKKVTIDARDATIQQVLNEIFIATPLTYKIMNGKLIVISSSGRTAAFPVTGVIQLRDQLGGTTTNAGVVVREAGTNNATITNDEGQFTINVTDANSKLEISHIGYRSVTVGVEGRNSVTLVLEAEVQQLTDVVVTALGITRQKKALTYSTQTIKGSDLSDSRNVNITSAMTGRVAGLTINKTNSGPGGSNRIVFRGNRSLVGNNQPLIIVDGVRIDNDAKAFADVALFGGRDNGDGISNINPDDVETMSVLTGVSAAALYGSDAANGAIIVTTKKGKIGKGIGISIASSATIEKPMIFPDMQNTYGQGVAGVFNAESDFSWGARMDGEEVTDWTGKTQAFAPQPDNARDFFQTGNEFVNSFSLSSGTEKAQTYFSYTNTMSRGIVPNNEFRRNNFNLRQTINLTDKLTADIKANYIVEDVENRPLSGVGNRSVSTILAMPRSLRLDDIRNFETLNPDGTLTQNYWANPGPSFQNPYWSVYRNLYERKRNRIIGLGALKYQFTRDLSVQLRSSIDYYVDAGEEKNYNDTYWLTDYIGQGNYVVNRESNRQFNGDLLINYNKELSQAFGLSVNAGAAFEKFNFERATLNNNGLNAPNLFSTNNARALSNSQFPYLPYSPLSRTERQSVYAAAQLSYNNYLFLDVTGRNDWNSTLPPDNASYFFPSAGISAVVSDMTKLPAFLSYLKLRTSYAFVGNGAGFNQLKPSFILVPGGNGGFLNIDRTLRNANLKPEQTRSFEAGLDFSVFNNKYGAEITFYNTNTINQTLTIPIPDPSGYSRRIINAGNIRNSGIELVLYAKPVQTNDFRWNINLTFGANRNKVIELDSLSKDPLLSSPQDLGQIKVIEGGKYGELIVRGFMRDDNGQIIVGDNGLPLVNPEQELYIGNYNPDWTGGISNSFQFKSFTFSFLIDVRKGGKVISGTQYLMASRGTADYTAENRENNFVIPNSVTESGAKNSVAVNSEQYWRHITSSLIIEPFAYDATNARVREASFTYALPQRMLGASIVKAASISLVGRNLFFITNKADGFDPESSLGTGNNQGIEYASIPSTRSLGLYLKLNF